VIHDRAELIESLRGDSWDAVSIKNYAADLLEADAARIAEKDAEIARLNGVLTEAQISINWWMKAADANMAKQIAAEEPEHICGAEGFGLKPEDSCNACDSLLDGIKS
jgi:hypothetical protein